MSVRFHTATYDSAFEAIFYCTLCFLIPIIQGGWYGVVIIVVVMIILSTVFSLKTQIELNDKNITISKFYLGYQYFKYEWSYVYMHIENNYVISFANVLSTRLRFEYDFDDSYNYFVCYVNGRKVVLGKKKDFENFKEIIKEVVG